MITNNPPDAPPQHVVTVTVRICQDCLDLAGFEYKGRRYELRTATPSSPAPDAIRDLLGFLKVTPLKLNEADAETYAMLISAVEKSLRHPAPDKGEVTTMRKIAEICDLGSAREFGDADERLAAIASIIEAEIGGRQ